MHEAEFDALPEQLARLPYYPCIGLVILRGIIRSMEVVRISEAEAKRDFAAVLARVRAGAEVVIDDDAAPAVVLRIAAERPVRRLSESLLLAKEHASTATLDDGFAAGLDAVIDGRREPLKSSWD